MKSHTHLLTSLLLATSLSSCLALVDTGNQPVPAQPSASATLPAVSPQPSENPTATPSATPSVLPTSAPATVPTPVPSASSPASVQPPADGGLSSQSEFDKAWEVVDAPNASSGPSVWKIENGVLIQSSNIYRADDEYTWYEGTHALLRGSLSTDFQLTSEIEPTDNDGFGVLFRYQDENNFYRLLSVQDSANKGPFTRLQLKHNGVYTTLAEDPRDLSSTRQKQTISISAAGSRLQVSINGEQWFQVEDKTLTSGRVGLLNYASQMRVSKFAFQSLPASVL